MVNVTNTPEIFGFSDYRQFIGAWLDHAREKRLSNLSALARSIGVHTSFLAHVLSGSKNLSFEQATEIAEIVGFTNLERDYFFALIQIDRAGSTKLKKYWSDKRHLLLEERAKVRSRVGSHHELSQEDRAVFYSSWLYVAVFVATAIDNGQSLEQISTRFNLSREKASEVMTFLVRVGACELDGARYVMGKSVIYLTNDSPLVVRHHANWRVRALHGMDTREVTELFFTSPMSMSLTDFEKVRELLSKAIQSSLEICKDSPAEEVVCLNIDLFKVNKR